MALKLWFPFTGDTRNNGLHSSTVTSSNLTYSNNGKIGKCCNFTTGSYILGTQSFLTNSTEDWSYCCWMNLTATTAGQCLFSCRNSVNSTGISIFYYGSLWYIDDGARWQFTPTNTIAVNTWYHICVVRKKGVGVYLYVNGELDSSTSVTHTPTDVCTTNFSVGSSQTSSTTVSGNSVKGALNDVRVYDHALSVKEIKEISKGLVYHFNLCDNSIQAMANCFNYPTFNTSSSSGGWSHWGSTGHKGSYGQTTDTQYIYRKGQTYAHWVQNAEGATVTYLLYQSPSFDGGYRSLCCIVKEENSLPITEEIVDPSWNANSGTVPTHKWTSISPLGNGFYLCKCEGFKQDGSNDLVALCINPPYKVYVSECYLENNRIVCSDIFYQTDVVYDSSGYCNNGVRHDTVEVSRDSTPRNSICTLLSGTGYITADCVCSEIKTISAWIKTTKNKTTTQFIVGDSSSNLCLCISAVGGISSYFGPTNQGGDGSVCTLGDSYIENDWNHIVVVATGDTTRKAYCNGVRLANNSKGYWKSGEGVMIGARILSGSQPYYYYGYISDVRMYATQLTEEDILNLYHTPISISKTGETYTQGEFLESNIDHVRFQKTGVIESDGETDKTSVGEHGFLEYNDITRIYKAGYMQSVDFNEY